jgi:phenylpyruvate tautomerase PptA (4-oxalocrotonate tautomerase family)
MPAVQIDVLDVWSEEERAAIAEAVQGALVATRGAAPRPSRLFTPNCAGI